MIRLFKHYIPHAVLLLGLVDAVLLMVAGDLAWSLRAQQIGMGAQVNYPYGASIEDSRHKLEYDLYYVKNYTPFLDLLILLQTLRVVLWNEGAR